MTAPLPEDFIAALRRRLPTNALVDNQSDLAPHLTEWRGRWQGHCDLMIRPRTTEDVAACVQLCSEYRVAIVAQGGNTGLVGGGIPTGPGAAVLLNLSAMDRIRSVDPAGFTMTAEAGCVLQNVQEVAASHNRLFPLSLASEGSATLGGLAATNAGGVHVLRYGSMRDLVLGLEVVLADGSIHNGLTPLRKNNTGYDLRHLMIGSEGTLGVITALSLKLFPPTPHRAVALVGLESPAKALDLLSLVRDGAGDRLNAFEFLPRIGLEMTCTHMPGCTDPLAQSHPWYVLVELADQGDDPRAALETVLGSALDRDVIDDAVVATSEAQANDLWRLREAMSEAQKHEGGSIKHDIAVPVAKVPDFLSRAAEAVTAMVPGVRPVAFGHLGDGNVHFNLSQPSQMDKQAFLDQWEEVERAVHDIVRDFGGSISAEHGIGQLKVTELERTADKAKLTAMRAIKRALDPYNILNPGRVVIP